MAEHKTQRVRDHVHGLIVFDPHGLDARCNLTAWELLNAPEFQRLRRIRQLGVSEFTFPGAIHTRFAHSVGVFQTARQLVQLLKRQMNEADFNSYRADIAVLAALLHDLGHGPFSHAFESVQKARGAEKHHEIWTADIIRNPLGKIRPILERFRPGIAEQIADLLTAEVPQDIYHAIVSSSFDADRLDYLQRDRMMTGTGAGAIDFDWLLDNLRIAKVQAGGDDDEDGELIQTFCLDEKALQAAEAFLLARYHLFEQVYMHKTTRGIEAMIRVLLKKVVDRSKDGSYSQLNLDADDPLVRFFSPGGEIVENYLSLDDFTTWHAFTRIAQGTDRQAAKLARGLLDRQLYKALDVDSHYPSQPGEEPSETEKRRQKEIQHIEADLCSQDASDVLQDSGSISIYGEIGADQAKVHKMLSIKLKDGRTREITDLSPTIRALRKRTLTRFYFPNNKSRDAAIRTELKR